MSQQGLVDVVRVGVGVGVGVKPRVGVGVKIAETVKITTPKAVAFQGAAAAIVLVMTFFQ